jgi:hypothetical protein
MPVCEALQRNPVRNAGYCFGYDFKSPSGMPPSLRTRRIHKEVHRRDSWEGVTPPILLCDPASLPGRLLALYEIFYLTRILI